MRNFTLLTWGVVSAAVTLLSMMVTAILGIVLATAARDAGMH